MHMSLLETMAIDTAQVDTMQGEITHKSWNSSNRSQEKPHTTLQLIFTLKIFQDYTLSRLHQASNVQICLNLELHYAPL